jgi:phosphoglycerate kinase
LVASEVACLDFTSLGPDDKVPNPVIVICCVCGTSTHGFSHPFCWLCFAHHSHKHTVIGGSKVSTKLLVIQGLLNQVDALILTGGLAFAFVKAQGTSIGGSLVKDTMVDTAKELLQQAQAKGKTIILPIDAVCSKTFPKGDMLLSDAQTFDLTVGGGIPDGFMGLDAGPKTCALFRQGLAKATKIVFNGPAGVFEIKPFDEGTKALVDILEDRTKAGCITVVGGGDSVAALEVFGKTSAVSYVSTGLELLAGEILPGVAAIADYE